MLRAIQAIRPAARARLTTASTRAFSLTAARRADEHHGPTAPQIYGSGNAKSAEALPTDEQQATGIERFQLLGRMEGVDVFDMVPLDSSRLGTLADPIKVPSYVRPSHFFTHFFWVWSLTFESFSLASWLSKFIVVGWSSTPNV